MGRIKAEEKGVTLIDSVNSMWNDTYFQGFGISSGVLLYAEYGGTFLEKLSVSALRRQNPTNERNLDAACGQVLASDLA